MRPYFLIAGFAFSLLPACGTPSNSGGGSGTDLTSPGSGKSVDSRIIYGVWEGVGQSSDSSYVYTQRLHFRKNRLSVTKVCRYGTQEIQVSAQSSTIDSPDQTQVMLNGAISSFATEDQKTCSLDFPYGLIFRLEAGTIYIRFQSAERPTSLKKQAD